MKRLLAFLLCVVMIIGIAPVVYADVDAPVNLSRQLAVNGNKIVYLDDPDTAVRLAGVNIPSLEWSDNGEHMFESLTEGCDGWNANVVRLPVTPSRWFSETTGANYQNIVKEIIEGITARGKYIIIDCHTYVMPTQDVYDFWMDVCDKYGNNPGVLFGLCNEPHGIVGMNEDEGKSQWELWRNGGTIKINDQPTLGIGHQQLVEAIRDKGVKNILIAAGLNWGYSLDGITKGYALIDQGSDGDTTKTGFGIMYDSHIYPSKGLRSSWDKASGEVRKIAPLLIGEMGWDPKDNVISNDTSVYNLWMPDLLDWIDDKDGTYGAPANWTAWCFHPAASPRVITSWKYIPTYFNGVYVKERLLSYPDTGYYSDRVYENTFSPDMFTKYTALTKGIETGKKATVTNGAVDFNFKRSADSQYVGYNMQVPSDWCFEGLQTLEMDITPKSTAITGGMNLEVGFVGSDTEIWGKTIALPDTNKIRVSIGVDELKNLAPAINADNKFTYGIIGVYVGAAKADTLVKGDVTVDNIKITTSANPTRPMPAPYIRPENNPQYLFDNDSETSKMIVKKNDNGPGSSQGDYFKTTIEDGVGYNGTTGIHVTYNRINGIWGGFTQLSYPAGSDFADAVYASFMLKGNGVRQQMSMKIGTATATIVLDEGDTDWHQYTVRLAQLGCMSPEDIQYFEFHADSKLESELWADNIQVTKEYPQVFVRAENLVFENGFEDGLVGFEAINGESSTVKSGYYDGGFNSQRAYKLTYNNANDGGATAKLKIPTDWDVTGTDVFTFDARTLGGEPAHIELGLLDKVGVAAYTGEKHTLTSEWQRFIVPIYDYKLNDVAIINSRIRGMHIKADALGTQEILIDNISFSNYIVEVPVANSVNYINTFDDDVYGSYTSVGNDATNYINAAVTTNVGYKDSTGLVIDTVGAQGTNRYIDIKGLPADWDFSKAKYASFMVKGNNPVVTSGYQVNGNRFVMEWYYDMENGDGSITSIKTATISFDAYRDMWSNIITPVVPNTTNNAYLKGTNRIKIYSTQKVNGGIILDNLGFYDMIPKREIPQGKTEFIETFDSSGNLYVRFLGGYYLDQDNYLHKNDGGGYKHWGFTLQSAHVNPGVQTPANGTDYVQASLPMSWEIFRTTHMVFKARLNTGWKAKNYEEIFTALPAGGLTQTTLTVSLLDEQLKEYSASVELTSQKYGDFTIPLNTFEDSEGNKVDLTKVKHIRLYADADLTQSGFNLDDLGFITATPVVTSLTATPSTLVKGNMEINCTLEDAVYELTMYVALYKGNTLCDLTAATSVGNSITGNITIPDNPEEYRLKVFVWDRANLLPITNGYLEL
ncbi:MAG: cellulase family glycosylhydrolase [Eubacteriales bacterium]|nr:cellulase family glycosylhydrolase [Eubacteriales bacterium]